MEKRIKTAQSDYNWPIIDLLDDSSGSMEKVASTSGYAEEIQDFLQGLERKENIVYALVNALTAGEYYGPNKNGDYFPEDALKKKHTTFVDHGHVFDQHTNKDPKKSLGDILFSTFNDKMKRVELIISLDASKDKARRVIDQVRDGNMASTSMGCKVPYDICSICGKKAKTRKDYCKHLKSRMGDILEDGRRVYANNTHPRFFDLSIVKIPADPTSRFMGVFNLGSDEQSPYLKTASAKSAEEKSSEIEKQIDSRVTDVDKDPRRLMLMSQKDLSEEQIEKLSNLPLNEVLSSMLAMRVMPKRAEFQEIVLRSQGKEKLANQLKEQGAVFEAYPKQTIIPDDITLENYNEKVAEIIGPDVTKMSMLKPLVLARTIEKIGQMNENNDVSSGMNANSQPLTRSSGTDNRSYIKKFFFDAPENPAKESPVKNPVVPMTTLGALYAGYTQLFNDKELGNFAKYIKKNKWLAPVLAGGAAFGSAEVQDRLINKQAAAGGKLLGSALVATPLSYYASAKNEAKNIRGERLSNTEDFVRKHPFLTSIIGAAGGAVAQKGVGKALKPLKGKLSKGLNGSKKKMESMFDSDFFDDFMSRNKTASKILTMEPEHVDEIYSHLFN